MFGSNVYITNSDMRRYLILSNASCCSCIQIHSAPFSRVGWDMCPRSGTTEAS